MRFFAFVSFALLGALASQSPAHAAPITYTNAYAATTGLSGTSAAHAINGVVVAGDTFASPIPGGSANAGGSAFRSFANAATLTESSSAEANLAFGTLRGTAKSFDYTGALTPPNGSGGIAVSTVQFWETVTLNNATQDDLLLPFEWLVEGDIPAGTGGSYRYVYSSIQLFKSNSITTGNTLLLGSSAPVLGDGYAFGYSQGSSGFAPISGSGTWSTGPVAAPVGGTMSATLVVSPGQSMIDIKTYLNLDCRGGWNCDFGNTAQFSFGALPDGLTYTSASGIFLTEPNGPGGQVPEPGTWGMLAGGLLIVRFLRRP
jgi:hypothetical protein